MAPIIILERRNNMTYYVYVSAKFNKGYTIDASSKEEAMQKALEYIGEFVTEDESDIDNLDSIYMEVEQLPNTELEDEE